ncbi:MAG: V4R domain-containing protein [Solibacillus sp.]
MYSVSKYEHSDDNLVMTSNTFGLLRKVLIQHLGFTKAKRFLLQYGMNLGIEKSKDFNIEMKDIDALINLAVNLHVTLGHVSNVTSSGKIFREDNQLIILEAGGIWVNSFEAKQHIEHFGKNTECTCYILSGFASGILTSILDHEIFVKEVTCVAKGDSQCTFEVKTKENWEASGEKLDIFDNQTIENELEVTYELLYEKEALLKKITDFHSQITECIAQQNDIQKLLQTAYSLVRIPIIVTDLYGEILFKEGIDDLPQTLFMSSKEINHLNSINQTIPLFNKQRPYLVSPIFLKFNKFAYCMFIYPKDKSIDSNDHLYIERLAVATSLCFLNEHVSFEATERLKINFLDRLIHNQFKDFAETNLYSKYITPKIEPPFHTLALKYQTNTISKEPFNIYELLILFAKKMQLFSINGLISQNSDELIILVYNFDNTNTLHSLFQKIICDIEKNTKELRIRAGISNKYTSIQQFQQSLKQATQAMNAASEEKLLQYNQLGILGSLLEIFSEEIIHQTAKNELKELLQDDEKNRELLATLYNFLKNNQHYEQTAQQLALSVGGIRYRISKAEKVMNKELKDASTSAYILLLLESLLGFGIISFNNSYIN